MKQFYNNVYCNASWLILVYDEAYYPNSQDMQSAKTF